MAQEVAQDNTAQTRDQVRKESALKITTNPTKTEQDEASDPSLLNLQSKDNSLIWTIGGRFGANIAYYDNILDWGAVISDARIRTSLKYDNLYFYMDVNFGKEEIGFKDMYMRYDKPVKNGTHSIKAGYFSNIASMSYNTSSYSYTLLTRPQPVRTFMAERDLGVSYKFFNRHVMLEQGVFTEIMTDDAGESNGLKGIEFAGRWLYKIINREHMVLHIGTSAHYAHLRNADSYPFISFNSHTETEVDVDNLLLGGIPNNSDMLLVSGELLFKTRKFFLRSEYMHEVLAGLGSGAYLEGAYLILGKSYSYSDVQGVLGGTSDKNALEVFARYSYTNLQNDVPNYVMPALGIGLPDFMLMSNGSSHCITFGLTYSINKYARFIISQNFSFNNNKGFAPAENRIGKFNINTTEFKMAFSF
jgi:phosphate-selective porin OprO/OprP